MRGALRAGSSAGGRWSLPVLTAVLQVSAAFWAPTLPLRCPSPAAVQRTQGHESAPPSLRVQGEGTREAPAAGAAEHGLLLRLRRRALHAAGCAASAGLLLPPHSPCWAMDNSASSRGAAPGSANVQV